MLVLPEFWRQIIGRTNFFDLFIILDALLHCVELLAACASLTTWDIRFELLDVAEVAKLGRVVLCQKDIERLDIPMDHIFMVHVVHPEANMDEYFPEEVVSEWFAILFLDGVAEVTMLTILHANADGIPLRDPAIIVADHKVWI